MIFDIYAGEILVKQSPSWNVQDEEDWHWARLWDGYVSLALQHQPNRHSFIIREADLLNHRLFGGKSYGICPTQEDGPIQWLTFPKPEVIANANGVRYGRVGIVAQSTAEILDAQRTLRGYDFDNLDTSVHEQPDFGRDEYGEYTTWSTAMPQWRNDKTPHTFSGEWPENLTRDEYSNETGLRLRRGVQVRVGDSLCIDRYDQAD